MSTKQIYKDNYKKLRDVGYSAKEATNLKNKSASRIVKEIEAKIIQRLESGEKIAKKTARQLARMVGFNPVESDRIKSMSSKNMLEVFKSHVVPVANEIFARKSKDGFKYLPIHKSIHAHIPFLIKAVDRERKTYYFYRIEYSTLSDIEIFKEKKYLTKISNKKMTFVDIYKWVLEDIFPKHDETYGTVPDPTSIKVVEAYYMTPAQYQELKNSRTEYKKKGK